MKKISIEFAEILGLLCAEGSHILAYSPYWGNDRGRFRYVKNKNSERIEFSNNDLKLLNHFVDLLALEFKYTPKITKHKKVNICKKHIIDKILSHTDLEHLNWRIPLTIVQGTKAVKNGFIRGFFDGDGTASKEVRFFSTNEIGLKQLSVLLNDVGWKNYLLKPQIKPNRKPLFTVQLLSKEKQNFLKQIQPISKLPGLCEGNL